MGRVCHSSVISKRLVADSLANDCDPTAIAFDVDVRVMLALPCYAGCQTITRSLLDADERIRISVYDYDFRTFGCLFVKLQDIKCQDTSP